MDGRHKQDVADIKLLLRKMPPLHLVSTPTLAKAGRVPDSPPGHAAYVGTLCRRSGQNPANLTPKNVSTLPYHVCKQLTELVRRAGISFTHFKRVDFVYL